MKTRNLTEAARLMRVSQPAISQALRELEGQLGLSLFLRGGGRIRPTDEATILLPEVERLFAQLGSLSFRAGELKDSRGGQLRIAAIPVLAMAGLPQAIGQFREQRPRSRVTLLSLATSEVTDLVKQESVDLGFVVAPTDETFAGVEPLFETAFCCFLPVGHPLTEKSVVSVGDLTDETVIALTTQSPPGLRLREELSTRKVDHLVSVETNSAFAALSLVQAGVGIAIVDPLPLLGTPPGNVVLRPFEPSIALTVTTIFSRHRPLSRIALQFVKQVRLVLSERAVHLRAAGMPAVSL